MPGQNDDHPSQEKWNRGVWLGAVAVLLAASVVAVALVNGRSSKADPASARANALTRSVTRLLSGIPQSGSELGSPAAPVTLQFFGDLQCPTSRAFAFEMLPSLVTRWVRRGKLRVEYRSLKTATPDAGVFMAQQAAALAAGMQGKLWDYIEHFYGKQGREGSGYATEGFLRNLAEQTPGLDVKRWNEDRKETSLEAEVATDGQVAARLGLHETPSLLVGLTAAARNGKRLALVEPVALGAAVEGLLGEGSRRSKALTSASSASARGVEVAYRTAGSSAGRGRVRC